MSLSTSTSYLCCAALQNAGRIRRFCLLYLMAPGLLIINPAVVQGANNPSFAGGETSDAAAFGEYGVADCGDAGGKRVGDGSEVRIIETECEERRYGRTKWKSRINRKPRGGMVRVYTAKRSGCQNGNPILV